MRRSRTIQKLRNNELVRICGMGHYIPAYIRHAKEFGYDCIWLDLEHRAMDNREIQALLAFFHLYDVDCMLRPPTLEKSRLYRYFEDGASGLMIPHVSTAEKAQQLVQAVKFPPLGDRGIDAAGLDADFSLPDHAAYTQEANRETFLVVQIETPEAVENVDEIASGRRRRWFVFGSRRPWYQDQQSTNVWFDGGDRASKNCGRLSETW